jgi:16S rRNA (cytosine967-C5)-methyltransferase
VTPARRIAFQLLRAVDAGALAAGALLKTAAHLDPRDAALATELVFGVLRRRAQLHCLLAPLAARPLASLDPAVRTALELGAYQLRFLDRVPAHAAVSESVDLVRLARRGRAAGLVNALLRRLPPLPAQWPDPATEFSLPAWLLDRWIRNLGPERARAAAAAALSPPATYVRVPPGADVPAGFEPTSVPGCYLARGPVPPSLRRQDISAQSIVPLLDLQPGHRFLDLCAAPGNKTAQALETPLALAVACDASPRRLTALDVSGARRVRLDAASPLPFPPVFDRILVDAPCSGTGTLARNPEIRWRLQPADLARHAARQRAILRAALACLAPGGRLVYSTCSLEPEENEEVVSEVAPSRVQSLVRRIPGRDPGDGFFAAVLIHGA